MTPRATSLCWRGLAAILAVAATLAAAPVAAQGLSLGSGGGNQPIEILADEGIEWHRETQRYIARGNASARQGDTTVYGDVLIAYYRSQPGGGTEIFRYEVQGKVRIETPTQNAVGDKGVYDVDTGVLVLTGKALKLTTPNEIVTARDSLEYWEKRRIAVARGNAVVISEDRRMTADVLTAHFVEGRAAPQTAAARPGQRPTGTRKARQAPAPANSNANGGQRLQRLEGFGNVHVSTATDIVRADRGVYNADTGIAMMSGSVRITRDKNQLNGDFAEVNLNTGISKLLTRADSGDRRVRGLFVPQKEGEGGPAPAMPGQSRTAPPGGTGTTP